MDIKDRGDEDESDEENDENELNEFSDHEDDEENLNKPEITTSPVVLDFANINNDRCFSLTGITKNQFFEVWSYIKDFEYYCKMSSINGLGFYLTRLRTGLSIKKLSHLIPIASYFQIKKMIKSIREQLSSQFVPIYLGTRITSRREIISEHTTITAKILVGFIFFLHKDF